MTADVFFRVALALAVVVIAGRLGALMNTRGLMELVVLTIGLDAGLISPTLFTMMVIMALATTAMTTPLLTLIAEDRREQ